MGKRCCAVLAVVAGLALSEGVVRAHGIVVDANPGDWSATLPVSVNLAHVWRNSSGQGEYVWRDQPGDERTDIMGGFPDKDADLVSLQITADATNIYFLARLTDVINSFGYGAPQLQIAIDLDRTPSSGQTSLVGFADTVVSANAAWEFLIRTGPSTGGPRVFDAAFNSSLAGVEVIYAVNDVIELSVPWTALGLGGPPSTPIRFTVATFRGDWNDDTIDIGGPTVSDVLDAVTNYGDPGATPNTWSEVFDGTLDYSFDVWFASNGEVRAPLQVSQVLNDPTGTEPDEEWIEVLNTTNAPLDLTGFKVGDEETVDDSGEGMFVFPSGFTLPAGYKAVVANRATAFNTIYGRQPDFEIVATDVSVPDLTTYSTWATNQLLLANGGDEVILLDPSDTVVDVLNYGTGVWPGQTAHGTVSAGQSLKRAYGQDTNDNGPDFAANSTPNPGAQYADLSVTKTDNQTTATPGLATTYTISVSNAGPAPVTGATVADTFPSELSCSTTCVPSGGAGCNPGPFPGNIADAVDLPVGASAVYTSVCSISPIAVGMLSNTATVAVPATNEDPNPGNDSATDDTTLEPIADLTVVSNTNGLTTLFPGQTATYTIVVSNFGPSAGASANVSVNPALFQDVGWTCVASVDSVCMGAGMSMINDTVLVQPGGTLTYTLTGIFSPIDPGMNGMPYALVAIVAASIGTTDPVPGNNNFIDFDLVSFPSIAIGNASVQEGNAGTTPITLTVTLAPPSPAQVTVTYATQDGTATAGSDYVTAGGSVTFLPGETSKPVAVQVTGDTFNERPETFTVALSGAVNALIGTADATGTVRDDEDRIVEHDGDGKSDITVFHNATGLWFRKNSTDGAVTTTGFGGPGYTVVPGDYDGDGITDLAVYHPPSGLWFVRNSTTGTDTVTGFGGVGYAPVRGDYDGDGKSDLAVFHDATGLWFIKQSSNGAVVTVGYGGSGYATVPGDYDGDGKTDIAVFHPPSGLWFVRNSSTLLTTTTGFGGPGYAPVRGDFDGDGKTDLAVFHAASGLWFVKNSSNGTVTTVPYGGTGYTPVPGRYDADGKTDIGVYHEPSGLWFLRSSVSATTTTAGFGGVGYKPVN